MLAFTCAIHVTDVRAGIVRGARTLKLTLLSWLLPIMALIAVTFLATLLFTGLEPLWSTRRATPVLLAAAAALVFLALPFGYATDVAQLATGAWRSRKASGVMIVGAGPGSR